MVRTWGGGPRRPRQTIYVTLVQKTEIVRVHCARMQLLDILKVIVGLFIFLLFASLPNCGQNQTAVSDEQHSLSDF
jgi:hypothetical protein